MPTLTKGFCVSYINANGGKADRTMTAEELRVAYCDIRNKIHNRKVTERITGLTRMRADELVAKCRELGLTYQSSNGRYDSRDLMIVNIRKHLASDIMPLDDDIVSFGKCKNLQYKTVRDEFPDYCDWVLKTVEERGLETSQDLRRLAKYLNVQTTDKTTVEDDLKEPDLDIAKLETLKTAAEHKANLDKLKRAESPKSEWSVIVPKSERSTSSAAIEARVARLEAKMDRILDFLQPLTPAKEEADAAVSGAAASGAAAPPQVRRR